MSKLPASEEAKPKGVRWWTDRAANHAIGILDSCDDDSFWGTDMEGNWEDGEDKARARAKEMIFNRIDKTSKRWRR